MATIVEALRYALGKLNNGQFAEVERIGREVLTHEPQNPDALYLLGMAARKQEQYTPARDYFRQAISARPDKAIYHFELGIVLRMAGDLQASFDAFQRAIELDPQMHAAYVNAGATEDEQGHNDEALAWYYRALELKPDCVSTHTNLGNSLQALGRFDESIASYRRALEFDPATAPAHWNLAMALLRHGQFREGWQEYEWRTAANETKLDIYPQAPWDGSSLVGKTLLVHAEQGIGDEILFASCYSDLVQQAGHCIFICEPRLAGLLARSFPQATVIGYRRKHERTPCDVDRPVDFQIPAGSLPRFLRPDQASFPQRDSFLVADTERIQVWRERFAALGPGLKVGISWRAGGKPSEQVRRTTDLTLWRRLFALPGVHYVNLQYGQAAEDLARVKAWGYTVHDWEDADALTDLEGLAAMIKALDLVIAVGNTTVHLAGSLGAPAWSLVAANPSWRWMDVGERVPWYTSVRLFRQPRGAPWQVVFDRVQAELCQLAGIAPGPSIVSSLDDEPCLPEQISQSAIAAPACIPAQESGMKFVAKLTETVERAVKHHQVGELAQAEALYRGVLKNTPQHADALHLLGVICQQTGRSSEAVRLIRQAIVLSDTVPSFHFHLGLALKDAHRVDEAIEAYRRAAQLKPDFVEVYLNLGAALQDQGRLDEAIECYQRTLDAGPAVPGLHLNLGAALRAKGQWEEARTHLERALELQPVFPEARVQMGLLWQERRQWEAAIAHYQQAVDEKPDHAAAYRCLGKALQEQQRWDEAIACFQRALELKPRDFESAANLGVGFEQQEQFALAAESYARALEIQPHAQTRIRLTTVLRQLGRLEEALQVCDAVIQQTPDHALAHWTAAQILLQQGDLQHGWREYAWRWRLPGQVEPHCEGAPVWDGASLAGKSALIHGDTALADMLLLLACLPKIISQAARTAVTCDGQLAGLLARTFPSADVRPIDPANGRGLPAELPPCDVQVSLARLPQLLHFEAADFEHRPPLAADQSQVDYWRRWLDQAGGGPHVGILWRSRHKANVQPGTSRAPALEHWQRLLQTPGVQFFGLLPDATHDEMATLAGDGRPLVCLPHTQNIDDLTAQLAALDLVISVDDLIAHLAGAVGREAWLVLPHAWGWQWPLGQRCPWYRGVRLHRPRRLSAWPELISRLTEQLAGWLQSHPQAAVDQRHQQPNRPHRTAASGQTPPPWLTMQHGP